jgi:hypothetical protein
MARQKSNPVLLLRRWPEPMANAAFPTLAQSAASALDQALSHSADKLIRVDCGSWLDVPALIAAADPTNTYRFGLTAPFTRKGIGRRRGISDDARVITKWRNESIPDRRTAPVVIVGRARGRNEAGLRRVPVVIIENIVFRRYQDIGCQWLAENAESQAPCRLLRALVNMTAQGLIAPAALDAYCRKYFQPANKAHVRPQTGLWELGLIPDSRVMDGNSQGSRLSLNMSICETLSASADSQADVRRLARLEEAADAGNPIALAAISFSRDHNIAVLKSVELDALLTILDKRVADHAKPSSDAPKVVDLFAFLDEPDGDPRAVLAELGQGWEDSDPDFEREIEAGSHRLILSIEADAESEDEESDTRSALPLFRKRASGERPESARPVNEDVLRAAATEVDSQVAGHEVQGLVSELLMARHEVYPLFRWADNLFELLLTQADLRAAGERYATAWKALAGYLMRQDQVAITAHLRQLVSSLDADWEVEDDAQGQPQASAAVLYPFHVFVLAPHLELCRYALQEAGQPNVGSRIKWALDRCVPAYPAVWTGRRTLLHVGGLTRPQFSVRAERQRQNVASGKGLVDIIRSFVGLHAYARDSMSILLIDPPPGGGIKSALRAVRSQGVTAHLRVLVASSFGQAIELESVDDEAESLGRFADVQTWILDIGVQVNLAVWFQSARLGTTGTHGGQWSPSRGLQNALTVSVTAPDVLADSDIGNERVPFVSLQPRDANDVVNLMMNLARSSESEDRFFEVSPMLAASEIAQIAHVAPIADWIVVGAPGPIGVVPPRSFAEADLIYIGREDLGSYGLFVYTHDLYTVRKRFREEVRQAPLRTDTAELESQLENLAQMVPNGVLRFGRGPNNIRPQIGLMAAAKFATHLVDTP